MLRRSAPSRWLTMLAACFGLLMLYIDLFIVNVALPAIGQHFHASLGTVSWTISGYVLMTGVLPIGMGRLADLWGLRVVYLAGLALFCVASLACGLAPSMMMLIFFRVLQGIGAAIMTPGTLSMIIRAFPPREHGLAIGIYGGISGLGLIAGPLLGGLLVQGESWRWIFFVNGPVGAVALILTLLFVPDERGPVEAVVVDWWGLLCLSAGLFCLLFGITCASNDGWTDRMVVGCYVGGLALLALFICIERRVRSPLLDLALLRNRQLVAGCLSFFFFSAAIFGSQPYWSLFMQNAWRFSPLQGGLGFLPATTLIALLTPVTGVLAQRVGRGLNLFLMLGLLLTGLSFLVVIATLTPESTYVDSLLPAFLTRGLAIPLFISCATLLVVSAVTPKQSGLASGMIGMARNIGTAFGVAVQSQVYLAHIQAAIPPSLAASRAAASQFIARGKGTSHQLMVLVILQGFRQTSLACLVLCGLVLLLVIPICVQADKRRNTRQVHSEEEIVPALRHNTLEQREAKPKVLSEAARD